MQASRLFYRSDAVFKTALLSAVFFLPISNAGVEIAVTAALISWGITWRRSIRDHGFPVLFLSSYAGFVLCGGAVLVVSGSWSEETAWRGILKWAEYFAVFFMFMSAAKDRAFMRQALLVFTASMLLVTASGFYQLISGVDFLRGRTLSPGRIVRMTGSLRAPNNLAAFYLFAIPIAAAAFLRAGRRRMFHLLAGTVFFAGFLLTQSRGAFLAFTASWIFFFAAKIRTGWKWFGGAALLFALIIFLTPSLRQNYITSINVRDITIGERLLFWKTGWEMVLERPLFGHGLNTYYEKVPEIETPEQVYRGYAHNSYLQIMFEAGAAGLFLLLIPVFAVFYRYLKFFDPVKDPAAAALCGASLSFLLQAAVDNHFFTLQTALLFWTFFGILSGRIYQTRENAVSGGLTPSL